MPELSAFARRNKDLAPDAVAREFCLTEGQARGGVEIIVVIDGEGKFAGAGTQNMKYFVDFPPELKARMKDPKHGFMVHHNHPPDEEPFFSNTDINGLAQNLGIGWLFMHTETHYSAARIPDRMFYPDAAGDIPALGLPSAFRMGQQIAQHKIFKEGLALNPDVEESVGPELALQALQQIGALQHYSSLRTGIGHDAEQDIVNTIRTQCAQSPARAGGIAIWRPQSGTLPTASAGMPGTGGTADLPYSSTLETGFDRFLDILSRPDAAAADPAKTGRPQPPSFPEAGGDDSGLASRRPARGPLLEAGLSVARNG